MFEKIRDIFKRPKSSFRATIVNSGKTFDVKAGQKLLTSALENGVRWPHYCRVGSCAKCRCKLIEGSIQPLSDFSYVLSIQQSEDGFILACQTVLKSDITLELH